MGPRATSSAIFGSVFALILIAALFTNQIPSTFGNYADQRILLCGVLIALVAAGLSGAVLQRAFQSSVRELLIFLPLFIAFFLAAFQFPDAPFFLVEPIFFTFFFAAFCLAGVWVYRTGFSSEIATLFVVVAVVACFLYAGTNGLVYIIALNDQVARLDNEIPWGFINIRYWGHVATWLLLLFPVAVLTGPFKESRLWRFGVALMAAHWWWLIFVSSARGSMVALAVGAVFATALFGKAAMPWLKLSLYYLGCGVIVWVVLSLVIPGLILDDSELRSLKTGSSGRLPLWQEALAMSIQHFPFGMGPQSWLTHNPITTAYEASKRFGHPHNMYLMWAAEYGWISVAALFIPGIVTIRRSLRVSSAIRSGSRSGATVIVALTASVVAALAHAGVSAVFMAPGSMLVGMLVLTLFWAVNRPGSPPPEASQPYPTVARYAASAVTLAIVAVAGTLWMQNVLHYHAAMVKDKAFCKDASIATNYTRFWAHGYFPRAPQLMPPQLKK